MRTLCGIVTALSLSVAGAADLTVVQGDSQTISENTTYAAVVVNGDLTVAPNVTLTCSSLTVANDIGAGNTATLIVGDGGKVVVSGSSATKIGVGQGRAEVYLGRGARFEAAKYLYFNYGFSSDPASDAAMTEAYLYAGTNSVVQCEDFQFGYNSKKPSGTANSAIKSVVRLDKSAMLRAYRIRDRSPVSKTIEFNGGYFEQRSSAYDAGIVRMDYEAKNSTLLLSGIGDNPVVFKLSDIQRDAATFASFGSKSEYLKIEGAGGFTKRGGGFCPIVKADTSWEDAQNRPNLRILSTGPFEIAEGGFSVVTNNIFIAKNGNYSEPQNIIIRDGALLDFAGANAVMDSIAAEGSGLVTNSANRTVTLTLGATADALDSTLPNLGPSINVVKQGSSALTVGGSDVASIDVKAGSLSFGGGSSSIHVGTLKLANGTKLGASGATVSCDTFTAASGLELDMSNGAVLPLTAAHAVSKVTVMPAGGVASVGVFNPEASGSLYIVGDRAESRGALLRADSCANVGNLESWNVYLNGVFLEGRKLCFSDGAVSLVPRGFVLSYR